MRKYFNTNIRNSFYKYSFLLMAAAALPFVPAVTANADTVKVGPPIAQEIQLGFSTADDLNLRAEASIYSESLLKVNAGDSMIILGEEEDWYKVQSSGLTGYMKKIYVNDECIAFATTQNLNLRETPDSEGAVVNQFNQGDTMLVLEKEEGDWLKVSYDGTTGYVNKEFVDFQYHIYVNVEDANVRAGATTDAESLFTLERSTLINVLNKSGEWYKVRHDGQIGYIKDSCTSFEEPEEIVIPTPTTTTSSNRNNTSTNSSANSSTSAPAAAETPKQEAASPAPDQTPVSGSGQDVVNYALQFVGNPYVYGGNSLTNGIDCSGFTQQIYAKFGASLPRSSSAQRGAGTNVASLAEAQPGDLICYSGHVAIYMGNNQIVHASNKKDGIKVSNDASYSTIRAIRRIVQ